MYQLPERAGGGSLTLAVSNIEEVVAHVEKLGIDATQRSSGARVKTLMIGDADGNHIASAEAFGGLRPLSEDSAPGRYRPYRLVRLVAANGTHAGFTSFACVIFTAVISVTNSNFPQTGFGHYFPAGRKIWVT